MPTDASSQFQSDKPFRLSLYVRPENLALNVTPKVNLENKGNVTTPKSNNNKENRGLKGMKRNKENNKPTKTATGKSKNKKLKERNVILFSDEDIPPVKGKSATKTSSAKAEISFKKSSTKKNKESKTGVDHSSVLNEIQGRNPTESDEFEKWAQSINLEFENIDKFELSITYDD